MKAVALLCNCHHAGSLPRMYSVDLTSEQAAKLHERIAPLSTYLYELEKRMDERGFSQADRLYWEVMTARYATQLLVDHRKLSKAASKAKASKEDDKADDDECKPAAQPIIHVAPAAIKPGAVV